MKKSFILTMILTFVVGISLGIFGLSFYQSLNNSDNVKEENKEENKENDQVTSVSYKEVKELFKEIVNYPPVNVLDAFLENPSKTTLTVEEINADFLAYLLQGSSKLEKPQICGTVHEKNLIDLRIISEIDAGQYDCESDIFYTIDSIKEASKEFFGKELPQFTTANPKKYPAYYYYEAGNIGIFKYSGMSYPDYSITDFYIKNSVLSIEFSNSKNASYKLNFRVSGQNFYLESIDKLS